MEMKKIAKQDVQKVLTAYENTPVYLHVEITSGMYASHLIAMFLRRNLPPQYSGGIYSGDHPRRQPPKRAPCRLPHGGWVCARGLMHILKAITLENLSCTGFNAEANLLQHLKFQQPFFK